MTATTKTTSDGTDDGPVRDYRYDEAKRKNNPPAGLAAQGRIAERPAERYAYNPHLPPVLRFDPTGEADRYPELLETARHRKLTDDEVNLLAQALRTHEPWLEWSGKREAKGFAVDPVALHIHERVSAQAIVKVAARQDVQRSLFADPQQEYREAVQFYQHDVDWANRLILGDSLQVMSSLAKRENLAGQVQMIYMDPPYGIKFASNFQPRVGQGRVSDRPQDMTRELEVVKAYRDTWGLGVHSYLAYLRDRFVLCHELLSDQESFFVQIGDENLHSVRLVLDEVFGRHNLTGLITFVKTSAQEDLRLPAVCDYVLWYAKRHEQIKYRQLWIGKSSDDAGTSDYNRIELSDGKRRRMTAREQSDWSMLPTDARPYQQDNFVSDRPPGDFPVPFEGVDYRPLTGYWKTGIAGMQRLDQSRRVERRGRMLRYVRFFDDFPFRPIANFWTDVRFSSRSEVKVYAVQTAARVIERCLLMATDPGDLVLDPTCGSGTSAYLAERWGRRWITIDTSRVAIALSRQRLLAASFDYLVLRDNTLGPTGGFQYRTAPHVGLKSIAQNVALDPIFAKHEPILAGRLAALNAALTQVPPETRTTLAAKIALKERAEGKRAITDADRRRWLLPKERWQEWEVPFDADPDWPQPLQDALAAYRAAWRAKMDEVNATIAASAEQEELVDQPEVVKGVVRVSGPFTVEAVLPPEERLDVDGEALPVDELDDELPAFGANGAAPVDGTAGEPANAEAYLDKMIRLLRTDGVRFPDNKQASFARLEPVAGEALHAEGEWANEGGARRVAVAFGPQYGPVTAKQVANCLWAASNRGYHDLVFAGFSFDAAAQATIQDDPNPRVRAHLAHIAPDVNMGDLLKQTPNSQLFTVFGLPRTRLDAAADGQWTVTMEGVDIYNPVDNSVQDTRADKVAAWFLDSDYDGRTFCICQAFFPDKSAWEKLARALNGIKAVDTDAFAAFSGTTSLPFPTGEHAKVAVKVIDPRGNEVMRVHALTAEAVYA